MNPEATVSCSIEHHAVLFALLAKHTIILCKEDGEETIQKGVTLYGNERGARMAANALANGDELNLLNYQAYGEWVPESADQMEFDTLRIEPTLRTCVSKCPWCAAWEGHNLLKYGKLYCPNIDNAVYQGFRKDFSCKIIDANLSFGGEHCVFDWGIPLSEEEAAELLEKKQKLGTSCMKDFTYHTAHLLNTVGNTIKKDLGEEGVLAVERALKDYTDIFGQEYLDVLEGVYQ